MKPQPITFHVVATSRSPLEADGSPLLVIIAHQSATPLEVDLFLLRGWDQRPDVVAHEHIVLFQSFLDELQERRLATDQGLINFLERIDDLQIGTLRSFASGSCDSWTLDTAVTAALAKAIPPVVWPESFDYLAKLADGPVSSTGPRCQSIEAQAIEGYRTGKLTPLQTREMLGLARLEFDGFLKRRRILDHAYGVKDLEEDLGTLGLHDK